MGKYITYRKPKAKEKSSNVGVALTGLFSELEDDVMNATVEAIKEGWKDIVMGTPVLTGYAQSSWSVVGESGEHRFTPKVAGKSYPPPGATYAQGILPIENLKRRGWKGISIGNRAPYIDMLETGYSNKNQYWVQSSSLRISRRIGYYLGAGRKRLSKK